MTTAIADFECILGSNNEYLIKELSVVDTDTYATQHWIFKHATPTDEKSRNVNAWLKKHRHSMQPQYGDVEIEELPRILNSLKFTDIFVKGLQKRDILQQYMPHVNVINMEDIGCPRITQLTTNSSYPSCLFHMNLNPTYCSFYKMFMLRHWYINNS